MEHIKRAVLIPELLEQGQVLVIYGPRRVGKTTLVEEFIEGFQGSYLSKTGDDIFTRTVLSSEDLSRISNFVDGYALFFIDEAQQVENIGIGLKLIVDTQKDMLVIATGSSSFDLANKVGEPLLGRKRTVTLYPVGVCELLQQLPKAAVIEMRDELLLYGGYPRVLTEKNISRKIEYLQEIISSALFKDIFALEKVKSPQKILDLVKMLAYQIGQPLSIGSLANDLDLDSSTIERYLNLLEKNFIIFRLGAYSRNLRNTLRYKQKYFFWDTGIRNAIINNFQAPSERNDIGGLWENFCIVERMKRNAYSGRPQANYYFYQSYQDQEIDLIEEMNGYSAFECKWKTGKSARNSDWKKEYPEAPIRIINRENFIDYLG
jgi:predicted AAA+ superfamily ATPase